MNVINRRMVCNTELQVSLTNDGERGAIVRLPDAKVRNLPVLRLLSHPLIFHPSLLVRGFSIGYLSGSPFPSRFNMNLESSNTLSNSITPSLMVSPFPKYESMKD